MIYSVMSNVYYLNELVVGLNYKGEEAGVSFETKKSGKLGERAEMTHDYGFPSKSSYL